MLNILKMKKESINELGDKTVNSLTANALLEQENKAQISFSIQLADRMYFVLVDNIAFIYLEGETVYLLDFKGEKHVISKTLDSLEKRFHPNNFIGSTAK